MKSEEEGNKYAENTIKNILNYIKRQKTIEEVTESGLADCLKWNK